MATLLATPGRRETDRWDLPDVLLVPGHDLETYFATIHAIPLPTAADETAWGLAARGGDRDARIRLAQGGLRLAAHMARQHYATTPHPAQGEGVWSLADAVQAANVGLWIATGRFDPAAGRLTTYATPWIRQSLDRLRGQFLYAIRLPVHAESDWVAYRRAVDQWSRSQSTDPTPDDLQRWLPWPRAKIVFWQQWATTMADVASLDAPVGETLDPLGAFVPDPAADPVHTWKHWWLQETVAGLWPLLTLREQHVLRLRYGFYGTPMTLQEIGDLLRITRERVRQIEAKALAKLRAYAAAHPDEFAEGPA